MIYDTKYDEPEISKLQSFFLIGLLVSETKGFYHIHVWACWPSWSYNLGHLYKLLFALPKDGPHERKL